MPHAPYGLTFRTGRPSASLDPVVAHPPGAATVKVASLQHNHHQARQAASSSTNTMLTSVRRGTIRFRPHSLLGCSNSSNVTTTMGMRFMCAAAAAPKAASSPSSTRVPHVSEQSKQMHAKRKPFDKVLIANRGEIACRVIRTCKRLGIQTVAIYSEADSRALHVQQADEAICIGPAPSLQSYLSIPKIIAAIKATGAQAVHPGYGFLSENKLFSKAVEEEAGAVFIGPTEYSIDAMGDKITSKKLALAAGVHTVPGYQGIVKDGEEAARIAGEIGYPVMIKASAGGGGKGMRVAYNDQEAKEGFRLSTEEARKSFGDDRIFVEKFIENPHHIEIQLVADTHGGVACFPERECSIQRRNQKVLEESPSVLLTPKTRRAMQEQAAMLARAVQYRSAGTVEFLVDEKQNFYFLEMNTRLQVEHPVTEYVTGEDLVEHMLWVAAGEALPPRLTSNPVPFNGWALEARVYAEDPLRGFLPSTGQLITYREPTHLMGSMVEGEGGGKEGGGVPAVRVDTGVYEGAEISMFYDPMISKLVAFGATREEALKKLNEALDSYVIQGLSHNLCFLKELARHPRFGRGATSTKFIPEEFPEGFKGVKLVEQEKDHAVASAALMYLMKADTLSTVEGQLASLGGEGLRGGERLFVHLGGGRGGGKEGKEGEVFEVMLDSAASTPAGTVIRVKPMEGRKEGEARSVTVTDIDWELGKPLFRAHMDGALRTLQCLKAHTLGYDLFFGGAYLTLRVHTPQEQNLLGHMLPLLEVDKSKYLQCPMPGQLISLAVQEGDEVEVGQELAVVEAMKMQNILRAPKKTRVTKVRAVVGASLKLDQVILDFAVPEGGVEKGKENKKK